MKILLIHPHDIYSLQEPWTIRIVSIAKELEKSGHQVKLIFFPLDWQSNVEPSDFDGIETLPLSRRVGPATLLRNISEVYKISEWADIIHFQKCFHWASIPALLAAFLRSKPVHYDWDDWEEKIFIASNERPFLPIVIFLKLLERYIPRLVDTISVSSERLKQLCIDSGIRNERICLAPVGADLDEFNPQIPANDIKHKYGISGLLILYLGQLHGGQYAHLFIEAAERISQWYPDVNFMLVGDGWCAGELKAYAQRLNLKNTIFTGAINHEEVPKYIAAADICIASFEDNDVTRCKSPLKIAEYLASGKPVVASDVGEVGKMIGDAGILTKAGDSQSLAGGIKFLIENSGVREKMAKSARHRAESLHSWKVTAGNIEAVYGEVKPIKERR